MTPLRRTALSRAELAAVGMADWAAIHHRLARAEVLAQCQRRGIKTMVWTVNADRDLARWMAAPGVDALVTDRPARAALLRGQQLGRQPESPRCSASSARGRDERADRPGREVVERVPGDEHRPARPPGVAGRGQVPPRERLPDPDPARSRRWAR